MSATRLHWLQTALDGVFGFALAWRLLSPPPALQSPIESALPCMLVFGALSLSLLAEARMPISALGAAAMGALCAAAAVGPVAAWDASALAGFDLLGAGALAFGLGRMRAGAAIGLALLFLAAWLGLSALAEATLHHEALRSVREGVAPDAVARGFLDSRRAGGPLINPNALASVLLLLLPCAMQRMRLGAGWAALGAAILVGFLATGSWGAVLALALALSLGRARPRAVRWIGIAVLCVGATVIALFYLERLPEALAAKGRSLEARQDYARTALRILGDAPLGGTGLATYGEVAKDYVRAGESWSAHAHSAPLEFAVELGLFALPLAAIALVALIRLLQMRCLEAPSAQRPAPGLLIGVIVGGAWMVLASPTRAPLPLDAPPLLRVALFITAGLAVLWPRLELCAKDLQALSIGLLAYLLHQGIDFAISLPTAMGWFAATVGAALALRPAKAPAHEGRQRALARALALGLAVCALGSAMLARDRAQWSQLAATTSQSSNAVLATPWPRWSAEGYAQALGQADAGAVLAAVLSMPERVFALPRFREPTIGRLLTLERSARRAGQSAELAVIHRHGRAVLRKLALVGGDHSAAATALKIAIEGHTPELQAELARRRERWPLPSEFDPLLAREPR